MCACTQFKAILLSQTLSYGSTLNWIEGCDLVLRHLFPLCLLGLTPPQMRTWRNKQENRGYPKQLMPYWWWWWEHLGSTLVHRRLVPFADMVASLYLGCMVLGVVFRFTLAFSITENLFKKRYQECLWLQQCSVPSIISSGWAFPCWPPFCLSPTFCAPLYWAM